MSTVTTMDGLSPGCGGSSPMPAPFFTRISNPYTPSSGNGNGKRALVVRVGAVVIPLPTAVLRDIEVDFSHARGTDVVDAVTDLEIAIVDDNRTRSGRIVFGTCIGRGGRGELAGGPKSSCGGSSPRR